MTDFYGATDDLMSLALQGKLTPNTLYEVSDSSDIYVSRNEYELIAVGDNSTIIPLNGLKQFYAIDLERQTAIAIDLSAILSSVATEISVLRELVESNSKKVDQMYKSIKV